MHSIKVVPVTISALALLILLTPAGWAHDGRNFVRFQATMQTTSWLVPAPKGRCEDRPNAPLVGLLQVVGAGDANLLGPVFDDQSHCVRADGTFDGGRFTLTDAKGSKIEGRYVGSLVATFNSKFPPPQPLGTWLISGKVCIVSIGSRAVSDCSRPSRNYEPARGITDLTTGAATIFLDQVIEFGQAK